VRPDGRRLQWRKLDLIDDRQGLLPSFIEWDSGSVHPAKDAPSGCHLVHLAIQHPDCQELARVLHLLEVHVALEPGLRPCLYGRIAGPAGPCDLVSETLD